MCGFGWARVAALRLNLIDLIAVRFSVLSEPENIIIARPTTSASDHGFRLSRVGTRLPGATARAGGKGGDSTRGLMAFVTDLEATRWISARRPGGRGSALLVNRPHRQRLSRRNMARLRPSSSIAEVRRSVEWIVIGWVPREGLSRGGSGGQV
jgi:hypothetical protein